MLQPYVKGTTSFSSLIGRTKVVSIKRINKNMLTLRIEPKYMHCQVHALTTLLQVLQFLCSTKTVVSKKH